MPIKNTNMTMESLNPTNRPCPLCTARMACFCVDLNYALFDDLDILGKMTMVKCSECGIYFNDTLAKPDDFQKYYASNDYYSEARTGGSGGYSKSDAERYARIFAEIEPFINIENPAILDFGCGKGGMLQWLKERGYENLVGIESGDRCRKHVRSALHIPVYESVSQVEDFSADIIILSHILEHLYSPGEILRELQRISKDATVFFLEVPNSQAYLEKEFVWEKLYFEHLNHFTEQSLKRLAADNQIFCRKTGRVPFAADVKDSDECLFLIGSRVREKADLSHLKYLNRVILPPIRPAESVISPLLEKADRISIWGISQYAQLVLGTYPELFERLIFLFDGSDAKVGRKIQGNTIRSSNDLSLLGTKDVLMIPNSPYLDEMREHLRKIGFLGSIQIF